MSHATPKRKREDSDEQEQDQKRGESSEKRQRLDLKETGIATGKAYDARPQRERHHGFRGNAMGRAAQGSAGVRVHRGPDHDEQQSAQFRKAVTQCWTRMKQGIIEMLWDRVVPASNTESSVDLAVSPLVAPLSTPLAVISAQPPTLLIDVGVGRANDLNRWLENDIQEVFGIDVSERELKEADAAISCAEEAFGSHDRSDSKLAGPSLAPPGLTVDSAAKLRALGVKTPRVSLCHANAALVSWTCPPTTAATAESASGNTTNKKDENAIRPLPGSADAIHLNFSLQHLLGTPEAYLHVAEQCGLALRRERTPGRIVPYVMMLFPDPEWVRRPSQLANVYRVADHCADAFQIVRYQYTQPGLAAAFTEFVVKLEALDIAMGAAGFVRARTLRLGNILREIPPPRFPGEALEARRQNRFASRTTATANSTAPATLADHRPDIEESRAQGWNQCFAKKLTMGDLSSPHAFDIASMYMCIIYERLSS